MGIGIVSVSERRSLRYVLINGGYLTVAFTVMGVILGALAVGCGQEAKNIGSPMRD